MTVLEQRLQRLQTDSQERVIAELNPLILGWANYYNGVVAASTMGSYDQQIIFIAGLLTALRLTRPRY